MYLDAYLKTMLIDYLFSIHLMMYHFRSFGLLYALLGQFIRLFSNLYCNLDSRYYIRWTPRVSALADCYRNGIRAKGYRELGGLLT